MFQLIGSSLLFVHNDDRAGVWLIDFAKTIPLPDAVEITHRMPWVEGTHEDGYLIGLENLIDIFEGLRGENAPSAHDKGYRAPLMKSESLPVGTNGGVASLMHIKNRNAIERKCFTPQCADGKKAN